MNPINVRLLIIGQNEQAATFRSGTTIGQAMDMVTQRFSLSATSTKLYNGNSTFSADNLLEEGSTITVVNKIEGGI